MTIITTILYKKKLYYELALFINSEMYEKDYISFMSYKKTEEILLKKLESFKE